MNLYDISDSYYSHPEYPYKNHIGNIAETFEADSHKVAAQFHDIGKLKNIFQEYINSIGFKKKTTHALEGALIFLKENKYRLGKDTLPIFISILKHHGNLEDVNTLANDLNYSEDVLYKHPNLLQSIKEIQAKAGLTSNFDIEKCCNLFEEESFIRDYNLSGIDMYFKIKECFSKLIFADKYEAIFKESYKEKPFAGMHNYLNKLLQLLANKQNILSTIRNKAREDTIHKLNANLEKNIFLIEAPTGIGKTFMALQLALVLSNRKHKKRIINALPMTSIIDQIFNEYSKIIDDKILLKYHHLSYAKEYVNPIQEQKNEEEFYKQKNSFINNSWAEDKVIITTFNQILNLFYSNKNSDLIKFWTLRDSVIIFDEIQAIPRILLNDFSKTINFMSNEFNIDFILMSATIPDIKNFLNSSTVCELLDNKYYSLEFNNRYSLCLNKTINSKEKLVAEVANEFRKGNSVLTVVNTKKLALAICTELKKEIGADNIFLLSSLFIPRHRRKILKKVKHILKRNRNIILVSTQVIEAGVDLDFDIGYREFSPLYSIIQTAGRINRENRNEIKQIAKLIVFPAIGYSPYHQTDLLKDVVFELISNEVRENSLLPLLKKYFQIAIKRTQPDGLLLEHMINLEFESVAKIFNDNFMKNLPYLIPVFIEYKRGLSDNFYKKLYECKSKLKEKNISLEKKMEIKTEIKDIYKKISLYVINVPLDETDVLPQFDDENEMKLCSFSSLKDYYSFKTGWKGTVNSSLFF